MTKERKKLIAYLVIIIILFSGGVGLGYYIWGMDKQKKPDYKKYLSKTIDYIGNLEKDNQGFIKREKRLKADIAALKKDIKDAQIQFEAQSKSLQTKTASLEDEKARLQSSIGESQKLAKEKEQLQVKIDQLINELNTVKQKIIEVQSPVSKEKEPGEQEVQSPVSKEKIPVEEKGQQENE